MASAKCGVWPGWANVPAVFLGDTIAEKPSMGLVHSIAAVIFAALGLLTLFNVGNLI